jgi:hypothetical protein
MPCVELRKSLQISRGMLRSLQRKLPQRRNAQMREMATCLIGFIGFRIF